MLYDFRISFFFLMTFIYVFSVKSKTGNCNIHRLNIPYLEWLGPQVFDLFLKVEFYMKLNLFFILLTHTV